MKNLWFILVAYQMLKNFPSIRIEIHFRMIYWQKSHQAHRRLSKKNQVNRLLDQKNNTQRRKKRNENLSRISKKLRRDRKFLKEQNFFVKNRLIFNFIFIFVDERNFTKKHMFGQHQQQQQQKKNVKLKF